MTAGCGRLSTSVTFFGTFIFETLPIFFKLSKIVYLPS